MKNKVGKQLNTIHVVRSALWFLLHFIIFIALAVILLFAGKFSKLPSMIKEDAGNYLYALFSIALLFIISYFYFYFENGEVLSSGRNIAMIFTVLDVYLILSCLIGYKIAVYARPVALVGLLILVLMDRKSAIFMHITCTLAIFVIDTFVATNVSEIQAYSSLVIAFCAGMIAIFTCGKAHTRFGIIFIGFVIVVPMDIIVLLLELSNVLENNTGNFDKVFTQRLYAQCMLFPKHHQHNKLRIGQIQRIQEGLVAADDLLGAGIERKTQLIFQRKHFLLILHGDTSEKLFLPFLVYHLFVAHARHSHGGIIFSKRNNPVVQHFCFELV